MSNIFYAGKERQMPHYFDSNSPFKQLLIFSEVIAKKHVYNKISLNYYKDQLKLEEETFIEMYPIFKNVNCGAGYVFITDQFDNNWCFGQGEQGQLGTGARERLQRYIKNITIENQMKFEMISCSENHTLAINDKSELYGWGLNYNGIIGETNEPICYEPKPISQTKFVQEYVRKNEHIRKKRLANPWNPLFMLRPDLGLKPTYIATGEDYSIVLQNGHTFMLGNSYYDIPDPKVPLQRPRKDWPFLVKNLSSISFVGIGSGTNHCLGWTQEGHIYCWGESEKCKLGIKIPKSENKVWHHYPHLIRQLMYHHEIIVSADGGLNHSCVLTDKGDIFVWGLIEYNGREFDETTCDPVKLTAQDSKNNPIKTKFKKVITHSTHFAAIDVNGQLFCWGQNNDNQLGLNDRYSRCQPTLNDQFSKKEIIDVDLGDGFTVALLGKQYIPLTITMKQFERKRRRRFEHLLPRIKQYVQNSKQQREHDLESENCEEGSPHAHTHMPRRQSKIAMSMFKLKHMHQFDAFIVPTRQKIEFDKISTQINEKNMLEPSFFFQKEDPQKVQIFNKVLEENSNLKNQEFFKSLNTEKLLEEMIIEKMQDSSDTKIKRWFEILKGSKHNRPKIQDINHTVDYQQKQIKIKMKNNYQEKIKREKEKQKAMKFDIILKPTKKELEEEQRKQFLESAKLIKQTSHIYKKQSDTFIVPKYAETYIQKDTCNFYILTPKSSQRQIQKEVQHSKLSNILLDSKLDSYKPKTTKGSQYTKNITFELPQKHQRPQTAVAIKVKPPMDSGDNKFLQKDQTYQYGITENLSEEQKDSFEVKGQIKIGKLLETRQKQLEEEGQVISTQTDQDLALVSQQYQLDSISELQEIQRKKLPTIIQTIQKVKKMRRRRSKFKVKKKMHKVEFKSLVKHKKYLKRIQKQRTQKFHSIQCKKLKSCSAQKSAKKKRVRKYRLEKKRRVFNILKKEKSYREEQDQLKKEKKRIANNVYKILLTNLIVHQIRYYFNFQCQSKILWYYLNRKAYFIQNWYKRFKEIREIKIYYKHRKLVFGYVYIYYFLRLLREKKKAIQKVLPVMIYSKIKKKIRNCFVDFKNSVHTMWEFMLWNQKKNQYYRYSLSVQWDSLVLEHFAKCEKIDASKIFLWQKTQEKLKHMVNNHKFISYKNFINKKDCCANQFLKDKNWLVNIKLRSKSDQHECTAQKDDSKKVVQISAKMRHYIKLENQLGKRQIWLEMLKDLPVFNDDTPLLPFSQHYNTLSQFFPQKYLMSKEQSFVREKILSDFIIMERNLKQSTIQIFYKYIQKKFQKQKKQYVKDFKTFQKSNIIEINFERQKLMLTMNSEDLLKAIQKENQKLEDGQNKQKEVYDQSDQLPFKRLKKIIAASLQGCPPIPVMKYSLSECFAKTKEESKSKNIFIKYNNVQIKSFKDLFKEYMGRLMEGYKRLKQQFLANEKRKMKGIKNDKPEKGISLNLILSHHSHK